MKVDLESSSSFQCNLDSIRNCSYDSHNHESLIDSDLQVVNYDKVKNDFLSSYSKDGLCSTDAFFYVDNNACFVEFKNTHFGNIDPAEITRKFYESLVIYCQLSNCHYTDFIDSVVFYLVYNKDKDNKSSSKEYIQDFVAKKANVNIIRRMECIEKIKGRICKDINLMNCSDFLDMLKKISLNSNKSFSYSS